MGKLSQILTIGLLSILAIEVHSSIRSSEQALQVAYRMLSRQASHGVLGGRNASARNNLKIVKQSDAYYVVNTGEGFVLVSTDDQMPEILGYSNQGEYDEANIPPALRMWLYSYDLSFRGWQKVQSASNTSLRINEKHSPKVQVLDSVAPLIVTRWGQNKPYNIFCPQDCNGHKCPTGCVTTALAQVMNYWKWPQKGEGEHTLEYVCKEDSSYTQSYTVNFDTTYHWEQMREEYRSFDTMDVSVEAVATLMYHLGVAQDMHYTNDGTGVSYIEEREKSFPALFSHFNYDTNVQILAKDYIDMDSLECILHEELMRNRPIFVSGNDSIAGGHAFVCDGYEDHYFHFNWGWNGMSDGWFRLNCLSPSPSNDNFNFNSFVQFCIGLQPNNANSTPVHIGQSIVIDSLNIPSGTVHVGDPISVNICRLCHMGLTKYDKLLGLVISSLQYPTVTWLHQLKLDLEQASFYGGGFGGWKCNFTLPNIIPHGICKIELVYQNEELKWIPVPSLKRDITTFIITDGLQIAEPITIYTITGQRVHQLDLWNNFEDIHNLNLHPGVYIMQQGCETFKIEL